MRDYYALYCQWVAEYREVSGQPVELHEGFARFVAKRIGEMAGPEVPVGSVRIRSASGHVVPVQIESIMPGGRLSVRNVHGIGFHVVKISDILAEDRGRMTDILNQMVLDGKAFEAV